MATIRNFEDIRAWQEARSLANCVYGMIRLGPFRADFGLKDQFRRAAGSVMHNIAEGFESGSSPEFIRFLRYARRSAGEVQSQLYLALDQKYINHDQFNTAYAKAAHIKKLINGFILYLQNSEKRKTSKPAN